MIVREVREDGGQREVGQWRAREAPLRAVSVSGGCCVLGPDLGLCFSLYSERSHGAKCLGSPDLVYGDSARATVESGP